MSTTGIIVLVVIVLLALVVLGLIIASMKKRSRADKRAASTLPEEEVRAKKAEAEAEEARLRARDAEERAAEARTGVAQQEAQHENQVRAADRLDPNVDHKAGDYSPTSEAHASSDPDTILDDDGTRRPDTSGGSHRS